jgi:hypothetical protein
MPIVSYACVDTTPFPFLWQCHQCAQSRPYIETLPCQDTCGIGTSNDVITGNPEFNDWNTDAQKTLRDGTVLYDGALCRDGGAQAASATCLYGTMVSSSLRAQ